jgi:RHS repeat-associated protein
MKSLLPNSRGLFWGIFILIFGASLARAQNGAVTIKLGAALAPNSYIYISCLPTADNPTGSVGFLANGVSTARVLADTIYSFNGQCAGASNGTVTFAAPAGYQVFVQGSGGGGNGLAGGSVGSFSYSSSGTYYFQGTFIVVSPNAWSGRAGAASSITSGQVRWSVALGNLLNGTSAGALSIVDPGTESSWSALWTPASLQFWQPSLPYINPEVNERVGSNGESQIFVDQAWVDVVPMTSGYQIRFYTPVAGEAFTSLPSSSTPNLYVMPGTPYVAYWVQQGASGSPTSLQITKFDYNTSGSVVHTAMTTLTRSGSGMNSYQWILDDWNDLGQQQLIEESRQWGGTATNRTETLAKYQPGGSVNLSVASQYQTYNWGEELVSTAAGSVPASTNAYITAGGPSSPSYGLLQSSVSPSGNWSGYDYSTFSGVTPPVDPRWWFSVQDQYQPFNNLAEPGSFNPSQGAVTTYQYDADVFGAPTRPKSSVTKINGVQVTSSSTLYADPALAATVASRPGFDVVQAVRSDCPSSGGAPLTTISNYFREDTSDAFLTSQTTSTIQPDGTQVSYAYQRGTFTAGSAGQPGSFTEGASNAGTASCIAVITGTSNPSAITECTSFGGLPIDPIYLVDGKSTARVTMRNSLALVGCVETLAWVGGAWVPVDYTNYTYDAAGHLIGTSSMNGATTSATYIGDEKTSEADATGVTVNYTYDYAGRVRTAAKSTGPTTTFAYDALGHVTSQTLSDTGGDQIQNSSVYDVAGRLYSTTPAGLGTSYYAYAYGANAGGVANAAYAMTTTYPDGSTKIEASQLDGRALSVRGSSVVEQDYAYAVESNGDIQTTATVGGSSSPRSSTTLADWLGRTVSETTPGFTGQPNFVKTSIYDGGGWAGHLTEVDQTGLAPTKYQYDLLGNLCRSGLDLGGGLVPASNDRITDTKQFFENYSPLSGGSGYWLHRESIVYPTSGSGTPFTVSITRTRLTGFSAGQLGETCMTDSYGNTTDSVVAVNPSTQTETVTTTVTGAANPEVETTFYGPNGLKKQTQGVEGLTTVLHYDNLERPLSVTDTRGNTTTTAYFASSNLVNTVTDATGAVLATYTYDTLGRKTKVVNASGYVSYFAYTPMGQLQEQWGSSSQPISYGYDAYGERTSMTTYRSGPFVGTSWPNPTGGDTTLWNYDGPSGLLSAKTDASGNSTLYNYYSDGQVSSRLWARLVSGSPLPNATTSYNYDSTGALLGSSYNDDGATHPVSYTYTRSGQLSTVTDATGTRNFNYDLTQLLQLDSISLNGFYNNLTLERQYNVDTLLPGRPTGFALGTPANPAGLLSQTYAYNYAGRNYLSSVKSSSPAGTAKFDYGYRSDGQLVSGVSIDSTSTIGLSSGFGVSRGYETQRNLLTDITTSAAGSAATEFDYGYNSQGQRFFAQQSGGAYADQYSGTSYNSVFNFYTYDGLGQVQSGTMYRNTPPGTPTAPPATDQLPGRSFQYLYDGFGNRATAGENGNSSDDSYTANNLNQYSYTENNTVRILGDTNLGASVSVPGVTIDQTDRNFGGDLVPSNSSPNASVYGSFAITALAAGSGSPCPPLTENYLVPAANQALTYDPDGNLVADGIWSYTYDEENRLTSMTSIALSGWAESNVTISFTYDYLNRRVEKKIVNNATHTTTFDHKYLYDGNNLVAEFDNLAGEAANGQMVRSYTWGLDLAGSLTATQGVGALLQITNYAVNGVPLSTPVSYFPSYDGNGNVASLINASTGALAAVYEYGPSGEPLRNQVLDSAIGDNPFRFSTKFTDVETKLVYYGARYYSPALGRFINRDPIGEAGGGNLYGFCGNDGVNGFDVGGMAPNLPTQAGPQFNAATQSYNYIQPDQTQGWVDGFSQAWSGGESGGAGNVDPLGGLFQGAANLDAAWNAGVDVENSKSETAGANGIPEYGNWGTKIISKTENPDGSITYHTTTGDYTVTPKDNQNFDKTGLKLVGVQPVIVVKNSGAGGVANPNSGGNAAPSNGAGVGETWNWNSTTNRWDHSGSVLRLPPFVVTGNDPNSDSGNSNANRSEFDGFINEAGTAAGLVGTSLDIARAGGYVGRSMGAVFETAGRRLGVFGVLTSAYKISSGHAGWRDYTDLSLGIASLAVEGAAAPWVVAGAAAFTLWELGTDLTNPERP